MGNSWADFPEMIICDYSMVSRPIYFHPEFVTLSISEGRQSCYRGASFIDAQALEFEYQ